jgi:hypothetical protein
MKLQVAVVRVITIAAMSFHISTVQANGSYCPKEVAIIQVRRVKCDLECGCIEYMVSNHADSKRTINNVRVKVGYRWFAKVITSDNDFAVPSEVPEGWAVYGLPDDQIVFEDVSESFGIYPGSYKVFRLRSCGVLGPSSVTAEHFAEGTDGCTFKTNRILAPRAP